MVAGSTTTKLKLKSLLKRVDVVSAASLNSLLAPLDKTEELLHFLKYFTRSGIRIFF